MDFLKLTTVEYPKKKQNRISWLVGFDMTIINDFVTCTPVLPFSSRVLFCCHFDL